MAAPLFNVLLRGRKILKPTLFVSSFSTLQCHLNNFSTSQCSFKKWNQASSIRRLEKMMTKKKKKFYFDPVNTSHLGKMASTNLLSRKNDKKLGKEDSVRLRVYNTTLLENIKDLVNSNYISEELEKLEVPILSVRLAGDLSVARVYWQASGSAETDDKVQAVLDGFAGRIRHELISLRVIGNVPRVCFLKDKAAANIAEIDRLLAAADFGPGDEEESETLLEDSKQQDLHQDGVPRMADRRHNEGAGDARALEHEDREKFARGSRSRFAVDHADVLHQITRTNRKEKASIIQGGLAPIADSLERFAVLQQRKRARKGGRNDSSLFRGQLEEHDGEDYSHTVGDDSLDVEDINDSDGSEDNEDNVKYS